MCVCILAGPVSSTERAWTSPEERSCWFGTTTPTLPFSASRCSASLRTRTVSDFSGTSIKTGNVNEVRRCRCRSIQQPDCLWGHRRHSGNIWILTQTQVQLCSPTRFSLVELLISLPTLFKQCDWTEAFSSLSCLSDRPRLLMDQLLLETLQKQNQDMKLSSAQTLVRWFCPQKSNFCRLQQWLFLFFLQFPLSL